MEIRIHMILFAISFVYTTDYNGAQKVGYDGAEYLIFTKLS